MSSNVIKARIIEAAGQRAIVKRDVQIACQRANEIVADAENEAQRIVSEARRKAQDIFDSAREDGYERGAAQWYEALAEAWSSI